MVIAMKSIDEPSLPLSVYGPTRSTQRASHGVLITILGGRCPYFRVRFLFTWEVLHDFVLDLMVFSHSFPVYHSFHCLFEMGMPRVLQIVVVPHNCMTLQGPWYHETSFMAYATFVFYKQKFQSIIQYNIAFKELFECVIGLLSLHDLFYCQRVYFVLFIAICKTLIQMNRILFYCQRVYFVLFIAICKTLIQMNRITFVGVLLLHFVVVGPKF